MALPPRRQGHAAGAARALLPLAALALAGLGPEVARAATPHAIPSDQTIPPACMWRNVASAAKGSQNFPDGEATTWTTYYYARQGLLLHIRGQFPYARYMSFTVQPISYQSDSNSSVTFDQQGGDRIYDANIKPDKGSVNPFKVGVSRTSGKRNYSVWVRFQPPTGTAHGNVLFGGTSGLGALSYRIYGPDKGRNMQGSVPLPTIDKVFLQAGGSLNNAITIHVPACSPIAPLKATSVAQSLAQSLATVPALSWRHNLSDLTDASGAPTNVDFYQGYSLLVTRLPHNNKLAVLRFKAPTFPGTYHNGALTGHEQVRYWSVCANEANTGTLTACVTDDQANLDAQGYATIVLGTSSQQPHGSAALRSANWLTLSSSQPSVLIYRQLLAASSFKQSIDRAPNSTSAMKSSMGTYYPAITICTAANWSKNRCAAGR